MLGILEAFNVLFLPWIFYQVLQLPLTIANLAGTAVALVILVQGAMYWNLKLVQVRTAAPVLPGARAFHYLRLTNWVCLGGAAMVIVSSAIGAAGHMWLPGAAFFLLAFAEQVNYFYCQLMYDNRNDVDWLRKKGLKRSHLSRDLMRWQEARTRLSRWSNVAS